MTTRTKRWIKYFLENKVEEFKWRETIRKEDPTFKDSR